MDTPAVEQWAVDEYREDVSPGAAIREMCRTLGVSGHYPTLKRLLEDHLAETNRDSHAFMLVREQKREAEENLRRLSVGAN